MSSDLGRPRAQQTETGQPRRQPDGDTSDAATSGNGPGLGTDLQEHIAQAVQPVVASFRQEMEQAIRQQMGQALQPRRSASSPDGEMAPTNDTRQQERQPQAEQPAQQEGQPQAEQPAQQEAGAEPAKQDDAEKDKKGEEEPSRQPGALAKMVKPMAEGMGGPMVGALLETLEEQGEAWLQSLFNAALDKILSEQTFTSITERVEQAMHGVLQSGLAMITDSSLRQDLQKMEQALQTLLRESLAAVFKGSVREDVTAHGQQAIQALMHREFGTAWHHLVEAIQALFRGVLGVVLEHSEEVSRLFVKVALRIVQHRLGAKVKESIAPVAHDLPEKAGQKTGAIQGRLQQKNEELREKASDATGSLQQGIEQKAQDVQKHVAEGLQSAVQKSGLADRAGARGGPSASSGPSRPPSGRPPSGRAPSGRAPAGQPPSGRPPSGRAPSGRAPAAPSR